MIHSDYTGWAVAVLVSLFLHGMMFMQRGAHIGAENAPQIQAPLITRLNFQMNESRPVPEKPPPVKKTVPEPVKKIKSRPVPEKPGVKPVKKVQKIEPVQAAAIPRSQGQEVVRESDALLEQERQLYLSKLMSHIESHKFYPRAARRRALQGKVKIKFSLRDDGDYQQLVLDGRQKLLVNATRQALEAARPLPVPTGSFRLSGPIELTMLYSLAD